jgi:hypothetical protein
MQPAPPRVEHDVEKGPSRSRKVYGTFITKLLSKSNDEKSQREQGAPDNVWWALGVSLLVVGTIAIYAFVIVSAIL